MATLARTFSRLGRPSRRLGSRDIPYAEAFSGPNDGLLALRFADADLDREPMLNSGCHTRHPFDPFDLFR